MVGPLAAASIYIPIKCTKGSHDFKSCAEMFTGLLTALAAFIGDIATAFMILLDGQNVAIVQNLLYFKVAHDTLLVAFLKPITDWFGIQDKFYELIALLCFAIGYQLYWGLHIKDYLYQDQF